MGTKTIRIILFVVFIWMGYFMGEAQVTIGSDLDPVKGALLELKDHLTGADSTNATKGGLLLPRVLLVDKNTLQPFIKTNDAEWSANAIAKTRTDHIGLTVYNLTDSAYFHAGIYIWTGLDWKPLEIASAFIYAPSFNLPWDDTNFDIYKAYRENVQPANLSRYVSSKKDGNPFVAFPDFESRAESFYYAVSYYDPNVLTINSISEQGVMTYHKTDSLAVAPPEDAYINVIMIRK